MYINIKHKRVMLVDDDGVMSSYQCCFIAFKLLNQQPLYRAGLETNVCNWTA